MAGKFDRRAFIARAGRLAAAGTGLAGVAGCTRPEQRGRYLKDPKRPRKLFVERVGQFRAGEVSTGVDVAMASEAEGPDLPTDVMKGLVRRAVDALGGIERFVHRGDKVVLKPNLAFARVPGSGPNTRPEVIAATIELCREAGAREILVVENTIDTSAIAFLMNGGQEVCDSLGVKLIAADNEQMYKQIAIGGELVKTEAVVEHVLECDAYINMPVAKQHNQADVCVSMKNQMGAIWRPQDYHELGLHQCIAELASGLQPTLVIVDAITILLSGGPKGPGDVAVKNTVLAGVDQVAIDTEGARLVGFEPATIAGGENQITYAAGMNVGKQNGIQIARC